MKEYLSIFQFSEGNQPVEKIRVILLHLFVFFLPYDKFYTTLILFLVIASVLLDFRQIKWKSIPRKFWIFQLVFLLSVTGYLYSYDKPSASFLIERQLAIFIFPLILPLAIDITREKTKALMITFTLSCVLSVLLLLAFAFAHIHQHHLGLKAVFSSDYLNHNFSKPIGIHAGYLSVFISLCITFVMLHLFSRKASENLFAIFCLLVLSVGLFFLSSRNTILLTGMIVFVVYPFFYLKKRRWIYFLSGIAAVFLFILLISQNEFLKSRFSSHLLEEINFNPNKKKTVVIEPRSDRWLLGMELIKDSPVVGHGTGDEIFLLKKKYKENKFFISYIENFNIHNQYLSILIKHGIVGLMVFLLAFSYYFRISVKGKYMLYSIFIFGLCVSFLTENILDSNKGIFYFAFFNTLFGFTLLSGKKETLPE